MGTKTSWILRWRNKGGLRWAGPGKLERNDKYGKWIGRIETVCEAWDNFSSNVLDAVSPLQLIETDVEARRGSR